ncbi:MAG: hypothetical protein LAN62_09870 [Acidobacteriia bacterium]|nr:hypothetical protein [Terriglobia bacterium]
MQRNELKRRHRELLDVVEALNGQLAGIQQDLHVLRALLNDRPAFPTVEEGRRVTHQVREYVEAWRRSSDLPRAAPELYRRFKRSVERTKVVLKDEAFVRKHTPWKLYMGTPVALMINTTTPEDYAATLFLKFLNLTRELGVNAILRCDRCKRYFINKFGHRNKRFCSRSCAVALTVQRRRVSLYTEKLARAAQLLVEQKPKDDWKAWVDQRTGGRWAEKRISRNWLTQAVRKGFLTEMGKLTSQGKEMIRSQAESL